MSKGIMKLCLIVTISMTLSSCRENEQTGRISSISQDIEIRASECPEPDPDKIGELNMTEKIQRSDEEWRKLLTPEQYYITREKGTERAFSGEYWKTKTPGVYLCVACGQELFSSEHKFDSGTGWPSFWQPVKTEHVAAHTDRSHGMIRTEVVCGRCEAHLGHVFEDGPKPTGLRYCINSASLKLEEKK